MTDTERQYGRRAVEVGNIGRNVATNLRRLRDAPSLSTRDLSALLGKEGRSIPASGVTRIEKGERRVDVDDLVALATALDVDPFQLMLSPAELPIRLVIGQDGKAR